MAYEINKSDGTSITINDGQINNVDSNMQLIGRNRADYGAPIAQNFVRLLENFAAESAPNDNPNVSGSALAGQLWYKPSTNTLSVFNGTEWQSILTAGGGGGGTVTVDTLEAATINADNIGSSGNRVGSIFVEDFDATNGTIGTLSVTGNAGIDGILTVDTITGTGNEVTINDQLNVTTVNYGGAYVIDNDSIGETGSRVPIGWFNTLRTDQLYVDQIAVESDTDIAVNSKMNLTAGAEISDIDVTGAASFSGTTGLLGGGELGGGPWTLSTTLTVDGAIVLGTGTVEANYADIAERFKADKAYDAGTLVQVGGPNEVTETTESYSDDVFGVVADNPAFILNNNTQVIELMPAITLVGRTPVKVIGKVKKGDRLTSSHVAGVAMAADKEQLSMFNYVGRALEDKDTDDQSLIWVAFGAK